MPDPEIEALEAALRTAQLTADVSALNSLISDDLLFTGPNGALASKADDLESYRSGVVRFSAHEPIDLAVRRVGPDVAVTALRTRLTGVAAGSPFTGTYRYTRVWARTTGGAWQIVAGHVSEVPGGA